MKGGREEGCKIKGGRNTRKRRGYTRGGKNEVTPYKVTRAQEFSVCSNHSTPNSSCLLEPSPAVNNIW